MEKNPADEQKIVGAAIMEIEEFVKSLCHQNYFSGGGGQVSAGGALEHVGSLCWSLLRCLPDMILYQAGGHSGEAVAVGCQEGPRQGSTTERVVSACDGAEGPPQARKRRDESG